MSIIDFIQYLNHFSTETMWLLQLAFAYCALLLLLRLFSTSGIYVYIAVMIIAANIEILKVVNFAFFEHPIALGTIFYSAAYIASDILTEYYGAHAARKGILIGFAGSILMLACMLLAMGFRPLTALEASHSGIFTAGKTQADLITVFTPTFAILTASLTSYLISQFTDVWIFKTIKTLTQKKWLWLRSNLSTMLAAILDGIVFNVLAWRWFSAHPVSWNTLAYTYILPTYAIRLVITISGTPFIYWAKHMIPKNNKKECA